MTLSVYRPVQPVCLYSNYRQPGTSTPYDLNFLLPSIAALALTSRSHGNQVGLVNSGLSSRLYVNVMDEKQVEEDYSQLSIEERLRHKVSLSQPRGGEVYWQGWSLSWEGPSK